MALLQHINDINDIIYPWHFYSNCSTHAPPEWLQPLSILLYLYLNCRLWLQSFSGHHFVFMTFSAGVLQPQRPSVSAVKCQTELISFQRGSSADLLRMRQWGICCVGSRVASLRSPADAFYAVVTVTAARHRWSGCALNKHAGIHAELLALLLPWYPTHCYFGTKRTVTFASFDNKRLECCDGRSPRMPSTDAIQWSHSSWSLHAKKLLLYGTSQTYRTRVVYFRED